MARENGTAVKASNGVAARGYMAWHYGVSCCSTAGGIKYVPGWDLLGHAETKCGETLVFMLPIINCTMKNGVPEDTSSAPVALVVAPTRELVNQLYNQTSKIAEGYRLFKLA